MKVEFIQACEIEVFTSFDEALDDGETETEIFFVGDTAEFDIIDHPEKLVDGKFQPDTQLLNVQFGDGSVAFGLSKEWFKEIP